MGKKTSMSDLVEHMGIHRRSLYDTFGNKHTLFLKAMDRFGDMSSTSLKVGVKRSETAAQVLQFIFDYTIRGDGDSPPGLYVNSAVELAPHDRDVDAKVIEAFTQAEQMLKEVIFWGQLNGEFTLDYDARELAEYL